MTEPVSVEYKEGDPLECYRQWAAFAGPGERMLVVEFSLTAFWLEEKPEIPLTALYLESGNSLLVSVTDGDLQQDKLLPSKQYDRWAQQHGFARFVCGQPIALAPLSIPKPWGQEIWYTGVEERGVCCFVTDSGKTPIPWLRAVVPEYQLGSVDQALVLLKILDPVAEPVVGDLYFELHEEKQEVYVVTNIDRDAWPDGTGYIRMGFDPKALQRFAGDDAAFREAYLLAVQSYEAVRRNIDRLPDSVKPAPALLESESALRQRMDSYSHLRPLKIGDVVKVPLLTPHSLQHGVRTVEFQTPVYERKILSFAQKVLTQDHWDTQEAVAQMRLELAEAEKFQPLIQSEGVRVERIVDFSDFEVRRVHLAQGAALDIGPLSHYGLVMIIDGTLKVEGTESGPEQALMLPRGWSGQLAPAQPASSLVLLLALPRH